MHSFTWLIPELSQTQWLVHGLIFFINIALLAYARPILNLIEANRDSAPKLRIFQALNVLVFILHLVDLIFISASKNYEHYFIRLGLSIMTTYGGLFAYSLCCYLSRKKFGAEKLIDNKKIFLDTYSSRMVDIMLLAVIGITTIYAVIKIWGADSLLETTGIFGIIAAFMAFTSNIWAPDIISGLIILNTQILEDGDVVVVDGFPDEYIISKVTLIYVIMYDIRNNHRTLIKNSQFTSSKIDNLSRIASTDGVRQALKYNIGYPTFNGKQAEERAKELQSFKNKVGRMFSLAYTNCCDQSDIMINQGREFEWALTQTGDYALEYTMWFYLQRIPNTKVTSTIRKHLMSTTYKINEAVYTAAIIEGIDLSTPALNRISVEQTSENRLATPTA